MTDMEESKNHNWPTNQSEHKWGPWMNKDPQKGKNPPTRYRQCIDPGCGGFEVQDVPKA